MPSNIKRGAKKGKVGKGAGKASAKSKAKSKPKAGMPALPQGIVNTAPRRGPARGVKRVLKSVAPVLGCAVAAMIKGRIDEIVLRIHLDAIAAHQQKYKDRIAEALRLRALGNAAGMTAVPAHKAKVTEAKGEHETTLLVVQDYASGNGDYELKSGFSAGVGIDQIWYSASEDSFMLVEAKGPGATLSTAAAKGDQMSKQWVRNSLDSIVNSPTTSSTEKADAKRMLHAMDNGPPPKVIGRVVEALPGGGAVERGCPDKGIYHAT